MKILLISSTGGHFKALRKLEAFWQQHDRCWVTFRTEGTETALAQEQVNWAFGPSNRNFVNLLRNFFVAFQVIIKERPQILLTTGAGVAVPFIIFAKLLGSKTVFVESFTRVKELSLSARLVLPFLDRLYVQWASLKERYPRAVLITPQSC